MIVRRLQIVITVLLRTILLGFCCNPFPGNASVLTENKQRRDRRSGSCQRWRKWVFFTHNGAFRGSRRSSGRIYKWDYCFPSSSTAAMQQTGVSLAEKSRENWIKLVQRDKNRQSVCQLKRKLRCDGDGPVLRSQRLLKATDSSGRKGGEFVYCLPFELSAKGSHLCQKL